MRLRILIVTLVFLFFSCDHNLLTERVVTVVLGEEHPWEEASHLPLWYTLSYTTNKGRASIHLSQGVRETKIVVDRLSSVALCAYPLGTLAPLGGFVQAGKSNRVELIQQNGALANILIEGSTINAEAIASLDMDLLSALVGDATMLDASALLVDLLNGVTPKKSLERLERVWYQLGGIPDGYWVSEDPTQPSFWLLFGEEVPLLLNPGSTHYLNKERALVLTLSCDSERNLVLPTVRDAPRW